MYRAVIIFLNLLLYSGLLAQSSSTGSEIVYTDISGEIRNALYEHVELTFYKDIISFTEEVYQVPLLEGGRFSMRFRLQEATQFTFDYGGQSLRLYIEPGDALALRFDGHNFYRTLVIKGKGAVQNFYLQQAHRLFGHWDEEHILYEMVRRQPMDFRRYMDGLRRQKWSFLNQYPDRDKFSNDFYYYAAADIDYWWAYYLLRYPIEHYVAQGLDLEELPVQYYSFLNLLLVSNDRAVSNPYYLYFLDQYLSYLERTQENEQPDATSNKTINILVDIPNTFVMAKPDEQPILTQVMKGDRMRYLHERSDFKSKILIKDATHEGYWYKVKTGDGHIGWVLGVGLVFEESLQVDSSLVVPSDRKRYHLALQHLNGKALYYTLANDLFFRAPSLSEKELQKEVEAFAILNPIKSFNQVLKQLVVKHKAEDDKDILHGATVYQIVSKPEIMVAKNKSDIIINPVKENTETKHSLAILQDAEALGLPQGLAALLEKLYTRQMNQLPSAKENQEEKVVAATGIATADNRNHIAKSTSTSSEYIDIPLPENDPVAVLTTLTGLLENNLQKKLQVITQTDPITMAEQAYTLKLKRDNSFEIALPLKTPQLASFQYGTHKVPVYLSPEQSLSIHFDALHFYESLRYTGKDAAANHYLLAQQRRFAKSDTEINKKIESLEPDAFVQYIKKARDIHLEFLGNYQNAHPLPADFYAYAKAQIIYRFAYHLMNYPWEHPLYHDKDSPMPLPANYYDFLQDIELVQAQALLSQHYIYFLDKYFDYLAELPEYKDLSKLQLAEQKLQGQVLDFYKARILTIACKRGKAKAIGPDIRDFIASCDNEIYNAVLHSAYNEAKGLVKGAKAPNFTLKDVNERTLQLSDFKGKVVYLDFWASWCSPCVMQMRNSRQWKARFKDKEVVFVYVSLDRNHRDWRNFVKNHKDPNGIYLIADSPSVYQSKIAKAYHVKRLPTVFIIDKAGKVFFNSSKEHSHLRLADMIDRLLLLN